MNFHFGLISIDTDNHYFSVGTVAAGMFCRSLFYFEWWPHYKNIQVGFIQVYKKYRD